MLAARARGYEVLACAPPDQYASELEGHGIRFVGVPMTLAGMNPLEELLIISRLWRLCRREKPVLVHNFSTKAILYGTVAARLAKIPVVLNTVTGLGYAFTCRSCWQKLLSLLYKLLLRPPVRVTVQNPSDRRRLLEQGVAGPNHIALVPGSGINTSRFCPPENISGEAERPKTITFLMYSRMMWEKGVREFCAAAKEILMRAQKKGGAQSARFILLGGARVGNPTNVAAEWLANPLSIPGLWLEEQAAEGYVEWFPHDDEVLPYIHRADVVVFPSYYPEGLPRSLLESMACGRAIITTDTPGCRDAVIHEYNGLLVRPRNVQSLVQAMNYMIAHPEETKRMGKASHKRVLENFSDEIIIKKTFDEYVRAGFRFLEAVG
jgi:glycosyltransferase involved in cell wall biosynthesis